MNALPTGGGLSARRKILPNFQIQYRFCPLLVIVALLVSSCQNGVNVSSATNDEFKISLDSNRSAPSINIQVNKSYDNNGNVVRFDSIYTSVYSSLRGDSSSVTDLMKKFRHHSRSIFDLPMDLFQNSIFQDEFFMKPDSAKDYYLRHLTEQVDSTKKKLATQPRQKNRYNNHRNS